MAVDLGHISIVKALLDAGANPNERGDTETVLCHAISKKNVTSVFYLVEAEADVNANCGYESAERSELTPLQMAVNEELVSMVKILVDAGANR